MVPQECVPKSRAEIEGVKEVLRIKDGIRIDEKLGY